MAAIYWKLFLIACLGIMAGSARIIMDSIIHNPNTNDLTTSTIVFLIMLIIAIFALALLMLLKDDIGLGWPRGSYDD